MTGERQVPESPDMLQPGASSEFKKQNISSTTLRISYLAHYDQSSSPIRALPLMQKTKSSTAALPISLRSHSSQVVEAGMSLPLPHL